MDSTRSAAPALDIQRSSVAAAGPSVAPSISLNGASSSNAAILKTLIERHLTHYGSERFKKSNEVFCLENRMSCVYLAEAQSSIGSTVDWNAYFAAYLASGGPCPPLNNATLKKKAIILPACIPVHLLLKNAFLKPRAPCYVEPVVPYYRSFLRRTACASGDSSAVDTYGPYFSSGVDRTDKLENYNEKDAVAIDDELRQRFGANVKTSSSTVTHAVGDIVRLAFGFAAGMKGYLDNLEQKGVPQPQASEDSCDSDDSVAKKESNSSPVSAESTDTGYSLRTESHLSLRLETDVEAVVPRNARHDTVYCQNSRALGKVVTEKHVPAGSPPNPITFKLSLGVLMTVGVESFVIGLGCPIVDIVHHPMDPSAFTPETLCDVLREANFSVMVCDDIGFELLAKAHAHWRSNYSATPWPIKVVVASFLFEDHRLADDTRVSTTSVAPGEAVTNSASVASDSVFDLVSRFALKVYIVNLSELILPNLRLSISRIIRMRANGPYSITKLPESNDPSKVLIHPRALAVTYDRVAKKTRTLWSDTFMASIAGMLALNEQLEWNLDRHDVIIDSRIEMPTGDALSTLLDLERSASNQLSAVVLALGGVVGGIPLSRLMFKSTAVQDAVRRLKPTICVGTNQSWSLFAKRLANAAGVDGAVGGRTWKHKLIEKHVDSVDRADRVEEPTKSSHRSSIVKESLLRRCVDPVAFRQGRQLLGSSIRLAVIVEPVGGSEVMHQTSLNTLRMLLSSSKRCRVVQAYSITGLGGHPLAMISAPLRSGNQRARTDAAATADVDRIQLHVTTRQYFDPKMIDPLLLNVLRVPLPSDLVDATATAPAIAGCSANGALEVLFAGVDETDHPLSALPSPKQDRCTPLAEVVKCRMAKVMRFSTYSTQQDKMEPHAFVPGTFAQLQHGRVAGPIFTRVFLDSKSSQALRLNAINNFLRVHCFPVMTVRSLKRFGKNSTTVSSLLCAEGRPLSQTVSVDVVLELNPLSADLASAASGTSRTIAGLATDDLIAQHASDLNAQLSGSILQHYSLLWPQGLLPDETWAGERVRVPTTPDEMNALKSITPSVRESIESVIAIHRANLTINECLAL